MITTVSHICSIADVCGRDGQLNVISHQLASGPEGFKDFFVNAYIPVQYHYLNTKIVIIGRHH